MNVVITAHIHLQLPVDTGDNLMCEKIRNVHFVPEKLAAQPSKERMFCWSAAQLGL